MIFLWSTSEKVGSKLIRWGLDEKSSHFALGFFEHRGVSAPVLESRLGVGPTLCWLGDFLDRNRLVYGLQIDFESGREQADLFHKTSTKLHKIDGYDNYGVLYWVYAGVMRKFFGQKLPHKNQWGRNELVYCVEVLQAMPEYLLKIGVDLSTFDLEMTSPDMMYNILAGTGRFYELDAASWRKNILEGTRYEK